MAATPRSLEAAVERPSSFRLYLAALAVALHFSVDYLTLTLPMIPFGPYIQGRTPAPFRYRILVAWIYKGFTTVTGALPFPHLHAPFDSREGWFLVLLITGSLLVAVFATERAIFKVTGTTRYRWLSLLVLEMSYFNYILPPNRGLFYPYDLPALAFFALLTWLAIEANYLWFALLFIPAVLNRETAIYALLLFLLLHLGDQPLKKLLAYGAALGLLFAGIKYLLYHKLHQDCSGCADLAEHQLRGNLHQLVNPIFWVAILSVFSYAWLALIPLWKYIQLRLRISFLLLCACWALPMLFVGILREIRIFAELSTLLVTLLASGLAGWSAKSRGSQSRLET